MRAGLLAFALAMVVAACGTSQTNSAGSPTVEITSIELDGPTAAIGFDVTADGELPTVQVNWGDDSLSPEIRGEGSLDDAHTYGDEVADATIVVTAVDEEGNVASAARSISLAAAVPGSDSVPTGGSTTTTSSSTTSEATTTTEATTTSTVAPTTTAPPPTLPPTTPPPPPDTPAPTPPPTEQPPPPPPEDLVIQLDPGSASFSGTNDGNALRAERIGPTTIGVYADAGGNGTSRAATATLTWTISSADLAFHGTDATISVLLEPSVSLALETDSADGNNAGFEMSLKGRIAGHEYGSGAANPYSIGPDDRLTLDNVPERLGFGVSFQVDGDLEIEWRISCRAHGADSLFLPFSISTCDALDGSNGVSLPSARITIKAPSS